ncbi:MAG TPA: hypothetical protein VNT32_05270 [Thermoleophilaceae bacterium]|nr:hypothetical protein [Thermoleophilaceae bacterium]
MACAVPTASAHHPTAGGAESHGPDPVAIDAGREAPLPGGRARAAGAGWCGEERGSDDTANEVSNGSHSFHAVYAIPADAPVRLHSYAARIQEDSLRASALVERSYGRAIRYDLGTSCGPQYLDITTIRLPETSADLEHAANTPTGTLDAVAEALDRNGLSVIRPTDTPSVAATRTRNWIVWLDGPAPPAACGQAMLFDDASRSQSNLNNFGGKVSVIFRNEDGFCGSNSVRHEIAHNLGAVLPRSTNSDGGHCTDAIEDTMCSPDAPQVADGRYHELFFDYGNDDYWDPPSGPALPWWTVNLSRFICPDAHCNSAASAFISDAGTGESAESGRALPRPTLRVRARRINSRTWRLSVRARGTGRATVRIRCRTRSRRGTRISRTTYSRTTHLPRTLRTRVRCASRPLVQASRRR